MQRKSYIVIDPCYLIHKEAYDAYITEYWKRERGGGVVSALSPIETLDLLGDMVKVVHVAPTARGDGRYGVYAVDSGMLAVLEFERGKVIAPPMGSIHDTFMDARRAAEFAASMI